MTTGIKLLIICLVILAAIMILSFIGPEKSQNPFWRFIQRIRSILDRLSWWLFNGFAVGTIILVVVMLVRNLMKR